MKEKSHALNVVFLRKKKGLRVDAAVEEHIKYLNGRTCVIDANINDLLSEKNKACDDDNNVCAACKNSHFPSGNHTCIKCRKPVHTLPGCSLPVDGEEEGFSEKRMCRKCAQTPNRSPTDMMKTKETQVNNEKNEKSVIDELDNDNSGHIDNNNINDSDNEDIPGNDNVNDNDEVDNDNSNDDNNGTVTVNCNINSNTDNFDGDSTDSDSEVCQKCVRCNKNLTSQESHSIDDSSESDAGYKVCSICSLISKQSTKQMLGKRTFENWRGQGEPVPEKKSRSCYIGAKSKNIVEMLQHKRAHGLPILKCGNAEDPQAVKMGKRVISLYNTGPFDSLFQLLLVAACDFPTIKDKVIDLHFH